MTSNKIVKGKPTVIAAACMAPSASSPPPYKSAAAIVPSAVAQNMRCRMGTSSFPPAVMLSITSEPESDDVTKNTSTRTMATNEVTSGKGKFSSIWKRASELSVIPLANSPILSCACLTPVPPNTAIQIRVIRVGINNTETINCRTVRPLDMRK